MLEYLTESFIANKTENAYPIEDWTVGSYLAPQMEMMERALFDIPGIEDVNVSTIVQDDDADIEQVNDEEETMELDDKDGEDVRMMYLDVEAEEGTPRRIRSKSIWL